MIYTLYNSVTGEIQGQFTSSNPNMINVNLKDKSYIEGKFDSSKFYIDLITLQPANKSVNPSTPWTQYNFDYNTKTWVLDTETSINLLRKYRNQLLDAVDRVNPIRYASLSQEQQTDLITYRQALLDIPQQTGFPETVAWPTKPSWL
jgi:hypothetical protein